MSQSISKVWIHTVWATKFRQSFIHENVEKTIYRYIEKQFKSLGCPVQAINGMPDHIHCLFQLNIEKGMSEVMKQIKGSTSHYINHLNLIPEKFSWELGYAAFSVSESNKDKVCLYIRNQKQHHLIRGFEEEYNRLIELHEVKREVSETI